MEDVDLLKVFTRAPVKNIKTLQRVFCTDIFWSFGGEMNSLALADGGGEKDSRLEIITLQLFSRENNREKWESIISVSAIYGGILSD